MLDWAEAAAGAAADAATGAAESGPLSVEVADTERAVIEALELRGYVRETGGPGTGPATGPDTHPYMTCLGRPLTGDLPPLPRLPDGYAIRAQRDDADVAGRAVCAAVLHAFARAGGHRAVVQARGDAAYPVPKRLYESLGFTAYARTYTYTRAST